MSGSRRWSDKELAFMREFVGAFPDEILRTTETHPLLEGKFPGRSIGSIYHGWRRAKGFKRKRKHHVPVLINKDIAPQNFVESVAKFIQKHIDIEVNRQMAELTAQNESLRRKIRQIADL